MRWSVIILANALPQQLHTSIFFIKIVTWHHMVEVVCIQPSCRPSWLISLWFMQFFPNGNSMMESLVYLQRWIMISSNPNTDAKRTVGSSTLDISLFLNSCAQGNDRPVVAGQEDLQRWYLISSQLKNDAKRTAGWRMNTEYCQLFIWYFGPCLAMRRSSMSISYIISTEHRCEANRDIWYPHHSTIGISILVCARKEWSSSTYTGEIEREWSVDKEEVRGSSLLM